MRTNKRSIKQVFVLPPLLFSIDDNPQLMTIANPTRTNVRPPPHRGSSARTPIPAPANIAFYHGTAGFRFANSKGQGEAIKPAPLILRPMLVNLPAARLCSVHSATTNLFTLFIVDRNITFHFSSFSVQLFPHIPLEFIYRIFDAVKSTVRKHP